LFSVLAYLSIVDTQHTRCFRRVNKYPWRQAHLQIDQGHEVLYLQKLANQQNALFSALLYLNSLKEGAHYRKVRRREGYLKWNMS
jgi:hypothetical protein